MPAQNPPTATIVVDDNRRRPMRRVRFALSTPNDGVVPYDEWPQWAQALLWSGVSVIALLSILGVVMLVKRSRR